ncbi:MAG: hypothetical protein A2355_12050 [Spirochaetes bacterium RIFOXYB1_FULL_32_8]|nr:MAG: hypothetical protein A2355_12050 [Spirochaetes bacterium RIFOXYB1_FULL_32_8]
MPDDSEPVDYLTMTPEESVVRGFVLGGSTAQGYPDATNNSFAKITERILNYGDKQSIEILNLSFSGLNSFYVNDAMKKILKYKPNFIIIYAGHNEIFGTFGAASGGNIFQKKLYMSLYEINSVRWLFDLINTSENNKDLSLMNIQFAGKIFENDSKKNDVVKNNFYTNISETIALCKKNNIRVFIFDPVSNLIDMPPFKTDYPDSFIIEETQNIRDIQKLIQIKDNDMIPFRARSYISKEIEKIAKNNDNVVYIPLFDILYSKFGVSGFGQQLFIDHLHFNYTGNHEAAIVLAQSLSALYNFDFNKDLLYEKNSRMIMNYSPVCEVIASRKIRNMIENPPYSDMTVKYNKDILFDYENKIPLDLNERIKNIETEEEIHNIVLAYLKEIGRIDLLVDYLKMLNSIHLSSPDSYILLSDYYSYSGDMETAEMYLTKGYLLSAERQKIIKSIQEYQKKYNPAFFNKYVKN